MAISTLTTVVLTASTTTLAAYLTALLHLRTTQNEKAELQKHLTDQASKTANLERKLNASEQQHTSNVAEQKKWKKIHGNKKQNNFLDAIENKSTSLKPKALLNNYEKEVFYAAKQALKEIKKYEWHPHPQVSYGEMIKRGPQDADHKYAVSGINSKRADILIADGNFMPILAIEYQGQAHYLGTAKSRDAIKKAATKKLGIAFLEIFPTDNSETVIKNKLLELITKQAASKK